MIYSLLKILVRQSVMDFRKRSFGTMLGSAWQILSPLVTIALIYFVFSYGLKAGMIGNVSFLHWFVPAMLAWFFISEAFSLSCNAVLENSHLVTKVVFPVWILPLAKVLSVFPVHLMFMTLLLVGLAVQHVDVLCSWIQLIYYMGCAFLLCSVLGLLAATAQVFVRDVANMVGVCLQILFWATPIFWNPAMLSGSRFEWILLSPFNYILQGYRDSLFNNIWFWEKPLPTAIFWSFILLAMLFALYVYRKCRPQFADVL